MRLTIRIADPERDYERIAELISSVDNEPFPVSKLVDTDKRRTNGMILRRSVVEVDGQIMAYSMILHETWWTHASQFMVQIIVDPAKRGQGIGSFAINEALEFLAPYNPTHFITEVRDNDAASREFVENYGFRIRRHFFESRIDLNTFDERPLLPLVDKVHKDGFRISSLAELGNTDENFRKLYAVNHAVSLDDPSSTGTFPEYEQFQTIRNREWFLPDGQFLGLHGDDFAGLSAVGYFAHSNSMQNMGTGVLREYRGHGLAQVLKLRTIQFAKAFGADYIVTNNDSENAPMLAINQKLGYQRQPGYYEMIMVMAKENTDD
jgi:GNAT superfamily N-acetyltransferase